jgi:ferritin
MEMTERIYNLLNEQIKKELYSAYLYLDMANYYNDQNLAGFENWFYVQAQEERDHAMLIRTYLQNNDQKVVLLPIEAPNENYGDYGAPLLRTLSHEKEVTASIYNIFDAAQQEKDFRTVEFLNWFIKEQGEEEKNATDLIQKYKLFGSDPRGLYLLDQELKTRTYAPPTLVLE